MKKLLITAIGAAVAFGAFADAVRFEESEAGTVTALSQLPGGTNFWSEPAGSTNTYAIGAAGTVSAPLSIASASAAPTQALDIKTTFGKPLSLNAVSEGATTNINDGLYFDSLVKFTVCDAGQDAAMYDNDGAKIVMWLEQNEAETQTNLIVRAGYLSLSGNTVTSTPTNYVCALPLNFNIDAWHRVTIKAIADITTARNVPGFAIYLDQNGDKAMSDINVGTADTLDDSFPASELTEAASLLNNGKALFPSLDQTSGTKATLTAASFDGTGSITDLIFTDDGPAFAKDMVATKASVKIGDADAEDYGSLAEAVAAVNGASEGVNVEFKLAKSMTLAEPLEFTSSANVVFDFYGQVLENTTAVCAITNAAGAITFIDSGVGGGITCTESTAGAVYVKNATGTGATFAGGIFRSTVAPVEWLMMATTKIHFIGGSYAVKNNAYDTRAAADNKVFQYNNETALYDVIDAPNYAVKIGQQGYETFAAALAAAADGDTITLLGNVTEAPFTINVAKFGDQGLTINLGGYTYTFDGGSGDGIYLLSSNKLTIANGTLAAASGTAYRDLVRDYNSVLTLNNVTVDGTNFPAKDGAKLACLLCVEGGGANILGNTSIINVKSEAYAIKMGNHAQAWYEMGTTTVNTTGNIEGNVLIAGGVYNEVAVGSGSTINYYYGKNVHSSWEDGVSSANFAARLGTLAETGTQDNVSGRLFKTLKDAVDAASAGGTVTVLADCTVAEPITFTTGITVSNDCTVTLTAAYALRFANGNTPVTFCGAGSYEQPSGALGSPILVGNNEASAKASYGMTSVFTGSLVLESGAVTILHAKNNVIKVESGSFVMNGGSIAGGKCGVKADSENGDATTVVTINGGTVNNALAAFATVVAGTGSATITVNGGEITGPFSKGADTTLTIPGASTAKFDRDQSAFCADGYETTQSGDWFVVTAVPPPAPSGIDPASETPSADVTAASAEAAIEAVAVVAPTGVDAAEYKSNFDFTATANGDGTFTVTLTGIKETVQETVEESAMDVLDGKSGAKVQVPAGLEYKVTTYTALGGTAVETKSGTSDGTGVSVSKPGTTQGFIKVEMGTTSFNQQ